jgi:ribosomal protein L37AE/L43A
MAAHDIDDCEDQGFSRIEDGCYACPPEWTPGATTPTRPKLEPMHRGGKSYWTCVKCGDNYGEVQS